MPSRLSGEGIKLSNLFVVLYENAIVVTKLIQCYLNHSCPGIKYLD